MSGRYVQVHHQFYEEEEMDLIGSVSNMEEHDELLAQHPLPHGKKILYKIWDSDEKKWVCTGILQAQQILTNG